MNAKKKYILLITISGIIFYILNHFTPLYNDDWHYNFIYGTFENINSLSDIIKSQYIHYFNVNGRFIPHFIVQLFDGILGKELFNIFNTIAFIFFLLLSTHFVKDEYKTPYLPSFLILMLCFFLIPSFNNCFLWMSGACNYLWVADILLLFNILLFKQINNRIYYPILFIIGIISGWTNEAFVIGLSIGYLLYFVIKKIKPTLSQISLLSGFYIGVALLVISPGSIHRALQGSDVSFSITTTLHNLISSLLNMNNIRLLPIFIIILLYSTYKRKIQLKQFINDNIIWITTIFITFVFVLFTKHSSGHSRFGFEFFSLLLTVKLLSKFNINKYCILLFHIVLLITVIYVLKLSYNNYCEYKYCIYQIKQTKENIILTQETNCPSYFERFFIKFIDKNTIENWTQKWIAKRNKKDSLLFIPQDAYNKIKNTPDKFKSAFYTTEELPFYIMQKPTNNKKIKSITFILEETNYNKLPFYLRLIVHKLKRYNADSIISHQFNTIKILDSDYIFIEKNNLIKDRVLYININDTNYKIFKAQ